jgi:murein DD-endopeptidase MepM/ murein hydrolase activator NlpD
VRQLVRRVLPSLALLCSALLVTLATGATAAGPAERAKALQKELDAATARYIDAREALEGTQERLAAAERDVQTQQNRMRKARKALDDQAAEMYRTGPGNGVAALLEGDPGAAADRMEFLDAIARHRADIIEEARAATSAYDAALAEATTARDRAAALTEQREEAAGKLKVRFAEAKKLADQAAAKARAVSAPSGGGGGGGGGRGPVTGGAACPLGQPRSFTDTWGASRSGGRAHQGVDMMTPHGTPLYAFVSGTVTRTRSGGGLGGVTLYLRGNNGDEYYYAHLQQLMVSAGQKVQAGEQVGTAGSSGNASASAPHLHFEVHPGGGGAVNPYPYVKPVCG